MNSLRWIVLLPAIVLLSGALPLARGAVHYERIKSFGVADYIGENPRAALIEGNDGALYGTIAETVFRLTKDGTVYTNIHTFGSSQFDGQDPQAPLLLGSDGLLYGTTFSGGTNGQGTIFKIRTDGSFYSIIYGFGSVGMDGAYPEGALAEGADGALYGTTHAGGANDRGTIFKLKEDGSSYHLLHSFNGGDSPRSRLAR